ncbi:MAG: transglutaminase-like domain-containing protein [Blautia sp.]|nr:transglutaminase-like domain-containing protein [Blautia sp.]
MKKHLKIVCVILAVLLAVSLGFIGFTAFFGGDSLFWTTYLQSPSELYTMESGILYNDLEFREGEDYRFTYDFSSEDYEKLRSQYRLEELAQTGSEFERARNLMNAFAGRLTHKGDYDNHVPMRALELLEYSLDNKKQGINCRSKAQILNEMCLSLGIYARKVWIMPNSVYDNDCHVVNEVWDSAGQKWVMLDITNNTYWVDSEGNPLSILEIREKAAKQEFCTPIDAGKPETEPEKALNDNYGNFLYIVKNLVYMQYCDTYTTEESENFYILFPRNLDTEYEYIISREAVEAAPE